MCFSLFLIFSARAGGQVYTPVSPRPPVIAPVAEPLVTAGFLEPTTPVDWQGVHVLRVCEALVEHIVQVESPPLAAEDTTQFIPLPAAAVTAGRQCYQQIGGGADLKPFEWPLLLRLAVALNDDSLVQSTVRRQLSVAGDSGEASASVRAQAEVLANVIDVLLHNLWGAGALGGQVHRTAAHDSLARVYAAWLDTMRPAGLVVATRLQVADALSRLDQHVGDLDYDISKEQHLLTIARSVPLEAIPADDRAAVLGVLRNGGYNLARLTYLQSPTHAHLTTFMTQRDLALGIAPGRTADSVLGRPAGPIQCDYAFETPAKLPARFPAPGVFSLLVFLDAQEGKLRIDVTHQDFEQLRQLHAKYPTLRIILITMTSGLFLDQSFQGHPDQEAARLHTYLTTTLQLPGMVCVNQTHYHSEEGEQSVPLASAVLAEYGLNPAGYDGVQFLVDPDGWVIQDQDVLHGVVLQHVHFP